MEQLENALQSALSLVQVLKDERKNVLDIAAKLDAREAVLIQREEAGKVQAKEFEHLKQVHDLMGQIKQAQDKLNADRIALDKAQADFANETVSIRQEIADRKAKLEEVAAEAQQVRNDKAALEVEKNTYRETIKEEILNNLKAGKF